MWGLNCLCCSVSDSYQSLIIVKLFPDSRWGGLAVWAVCYPSGLCVSRLNDSSCSKLKNHFLNNNDFCFLHSLETWLWDDLNVLWSQRSPDLCFDLLIIEIMRKKLHPWSKMIWHSGKEWKRFFCLRLPESKQRNKNSFVFLFFVCDVSDLVWGRKHPDRKPGEEVMVMWRQQLALNQ